MNVILRALFLLHFLNDGVRTAYLSLLPFIAQDLHLSYTFVGFLSSSQGLLTSILSFPAGYLASRIGGFKLLFVSLLIYGVGALGIGLSFSVSLVAVFFFIGAIGFGMFHTVGYALTARFSQKSNIGRNMGNFTAIGDIGRIIIPALALFFVTSVYWRNTFLGIGILSCACFIFVVIFLSKKLHRDAVQTDQHHASAKDWIKDMIIIVKQKKLLLALTAGVTDNFGGNPIYVFLPFLLLAKGVTPVMLGIFTAIYFIGSFSGKSFLGRAVDRFGNARIFIIAEACMAICLLIITVLNNNILLGILAYFLGAFTRGTTPVLSTLLSEVSHEAHYEKVYAISETFLGITAAIAPIALGIVADLYGVSTVFIVAAVFAVIATLPIFAMNKYS